GSTLENRGPDPRSGRSGGRPRPSGVGRAAASAPSPFVLAHQRFLDALEGRARTELFHQHLIAPGRLIADRLLSSITGEAPVLAQSLEVRFHDASRGAAGGAIVLRLHRREAPGEDAPGFVEAFFAGLRIGVLLRLFFEAPADPTQILVDLFDGDRWAREGRVLL